MKQVFLYVRVSTEEQALHGLSIEAQTAALESWARENGNKVVGVYTDAGISARKPASKRPALQRLLEDVRAGKGELVVFTKLDRWFRNISEYYKVQEVLEKHHVDWKTIHEDYDTSSASGRLKINIMLSVAQDEADRTSERIKAAFELKRQKAEPLTGDCPMGYRQQGKKFIKDPETESAVNAFFQTFLLTGSISGAMDAANQNGVLINYFRAHKMLDATCYYGRYFNADGMTPPYISKTEFDKIQSMRRRIVRKTKHNRTYLFSGIILCGECGGRLGGRVSTPNESFFYNCTAHYLQRTGCPSRVNISERKIEKYLMDTIDGQMQELRLETKRICSQKKQRDYKSEIAALRAKRGKLKELYINDLITLEEYKADAGTYDKKISALEAESNQTRVPDLSMLEKLLHRDWQTLYETMDKTSKRDFWRTTIKEIRVYIDRHIEYDFNVDFYTRTSS